MARAEAVEKPHGDSCTISKAAAAPERPRKSLFRPKSITNLLARSKQQQQATPTSSGKAASLRIETNTVVNVEEPPKDSKGCLSPRSVPLPLSPTLASEFRTDALTTGTQDQPSSDGITNHANDQKQLRSSLAMLDTQFASLHKLASSPRSSSFMALSPLATPTINEFSNNVFEHETTLIERPKLSPRSSSLPAAARLATATERAPAELHSQTETKAQELWNAMGLEQQENKALNCDQQQSANLVAEEHVVRSRQDTSTASATSDEVEISEFPSYSDLQAFANQDSIGSDKPSAIATHNRSSDLLEFPLPPVLAATTMSTPSDAVETNFEDESDGHSSKSSAEFSVPGLFDADNTSELFKHLTRLADVEQARIGNGEQVKGLGLFDSTSPDFGAATQNQGQVTTMPEEETAQASGDADDLFSEHSSHLTHCSSQGLASTTADTSLNASKEEVATYQAALATPHRFSALPSTPLYQSDSLTSLSNDARDALSQPSLPANRASASLHSLPHISRTQPTPPIKPSIDVDEMMEQLQSTSPLPHHSSQASASPMTHTALPPSPTVEVISMRPQSVLRRPSSTLEAGPSLSPTDSRSPSISPTPSRKSSTERGPTRRDSTSPADLYMRPTSALRLDGDFGFPLWDVSPHKEATGSPKKSAKTLPAMPSSPRKPTKEAAATGSHPGMPPKSPSSLSTAPRSPLAAPPLTAPGSPTLETTPTLGKRLSFGILKKRKSEQNLGVKSKDSASTTGTKLIRRSVSTPKLSPAKVDGNPQQSSTGNRQVCSSSSKPASPKTSVNKKRFSILLPQVFGNKDDVVPPVPTLAAIPSSAPPTATTFVEAGQQQTQLQNSSERAEAGPEPAKQVAAPSRVSEGTEMLDDLAHSPITASLPTSDDAQLSLKAFIKSSSTSQNEDDVVPRPARSSSYFATSLDKPIFPSAIRPVSPSTTETGFVAPFGEVTNKLESLSISSAPTKKGSKGLDLEDSNRTKERVASPGLSEEGPFGAQEVIVFPVSTPSLDQAAWHEDEEAMSSSSDRDDEDEIEGDEVDSQDEDQEGRRSSEDDKPLGQIPGALTAQKSLRQASKKSKSGSSKRNVKKDPFEFDKLVGVTKNDVGGNRQRGREQTSSIVSTAVGHSSLLPQTDDAVQRRSASLTRSPSAPLDPVVANSALTIDSPEVLNQALPPRVTSNPLKQPASSSKTPQRSRTSSSPHRTVPALDLTVASAHKHLESAPRSPSLAPPSQTASRSSSMSSRRRDVPPSMSEPPSRQPSQRRPSAGSSSMQRSRSNTAASNVASISSHGQSSSLLRSATNASSSSYHNSPVNSPRIGAAPQPPPLPTTEQRVFVGDHTRKMRVQVSAATTCGDVVMTAKKQGLLTFGVDIDGGFSLWEICRVLGVERPIREYEFVSDIIKSWDHDTNILIIKRTPLWPLLSASLRISPATPQGSFVQLEVKKGKWAKRYLNIKDNAIWQGKSEKPKDASVLCQLSSFEVFFVANHAVGELRAPKPFVFALKSKLPRAHYENESEYCHFVSVKTQDELTKWVKMIIEARNQVVRKENAVASVKPTTSHAHFFNLPAGAANGAKSANPSPTSTPSLSRNPSLRPKPSILALPTGSVPGSVPPVPASQGAMDRPDARTWTFMSDADRQAWLKDAQREARQEGKTLLDFSDDVSPNSSMIRR
ncbi:hypothetical protein OIO90_005085 [Microbotryomycetes sp. JL221]|nr:hypothetical protein OIO90_005085 [Microbotryomycetes sp. JL221]